VSLRIATRRSALALAQARTVGDRLGGAELVELSTAGDRGAAGGDKSRWVAELERAVLEGEADVAVHSAKDVPGELPSGLEILAVPQRADARDVLCGAATLDDLPEGARVGTSSLRRAAQLRAARDDLDLVSLRGNVDTRLRRLAEGDFDALVLAAAGLERLGRSDAAGGFLDLVPAPGQGALAVEGRPELRAEVAAVDHPPSHATLRAERALTRALDASCRTPIGAHATGIEGDRMRMVAFVGLPDGSRWVRDELEGDAGDPDALGRAIAERLLSAGAGDLLREADAWGALPAS
jgi:hydroxymethylbilane synthase